jgi:hypothetical protein
MKRSRRHARRDHVLAPHMLSSRFGQSLALVSIKLHLQVRLSVQSAFQHRDWNSKVSLGLSTDCHCGHRANPLGYTQSALISSRHLQNVLQSAGVNHTVFSWFKLRNMRERICWQRHFRDHGKWSSGLACRAAPASTPLPATGVQHTKRRKSIRRLQRGITCLAV